MGVIFGLGVPRKPGAVIGIAVVLGSLLDAFDDSIEQQCQVRRDRIRSRGDGETNPVASLDRYGIHWGLMGLVAAFGKLRGCGTPFEIVAV
jgi:hypothetical protein